MAAAITGLGRPVLGVDIAGTSVDRTAAAGALALRRSVFDRLPGEGRWDTVLLADGNLGIGADPDRLLCRVRELLRPGGLLLVEPEPDEVDERVHLCLQTADGAVASDSFEWARVGVSAAVNRAERLGFSLEERWEASGRTFLALRLVADPGPSAI
ncbi:SAM-dependent methyltransferase [Angustibacter sp. McL0619]|uniref:SAM-dependent methyltransferase n=1 Tax=Angustibacter sp. McL0619 TaxID=3415676 RepID=UPI003CECD02C